MARKILKLAIENKGKTNVTQVVIKLDIPIEIAKEALDYLHEQELLEVQANDSGGISYHLLNLIDNKKNKLSQKFID